MGEPAGSSGKGPPIPGPMPYFYALIEAAEREAMLSHPHAVEGFGMGGGFRGAAGSIGPSDPLRDSLFRERGWLIPIPGKGFLNVGG